MVGLPPAHPMRPFMALVSGQPSKEAMKLLTAGLLLETGPNNEPQLLLVLRGRPAIMLQGGWACFEKVRCVSLHLTTW